MQIKCLVCEKKVETELVEIYKHYSILKCLNCELQFARPIDYTEKYYINSYEGKRTKLKDYSYPLAVSLSRIKEMSYVLYTSEERWLIKWLKGSFPPFSTILDLGCGGGEFLAILKREGFYPVGMDIAPKPIRILKQMGFKVAVGSIDNYPSHWPEPNAIVLKEVLEHLANPLEFLKKISHRFSNAYILISVPSPRQWNPRKEKKELEVEAYPPNHFTRWNVKSLSIALSKAGYEPQIYFPPIIPEDIHIIPEKIMRKLKEAFNNSKTKTRKGGNNYRILFPKLEKWINLVKRYSPLRIYTSYLSSKGYSSFSFIGVGIKK